jgi:hypothetical protein
MIIRIPEPKKNGDKLLVWWLRLSTEDRWVMGGWLFLFAVVWLTGVYFAPREVSAIGRMEGWGQPLAALSTGGLTLVWRELVRGGSIIDNLQSPSPLWVLLVWIGPAGMVYFIWLLHQESWPWERPLAWMREKLQKRPRWLGRRRKKRVKGEVEVWSAEERAMALKALGRKRSEEDTEWSFPREPRAVPAGQTAVKNILPPLSQSNAAHVSPSAAGETTVEKEPSGEAAVQAANKGQEKPVQLTLPMAEPGEKSEDVKEEVVERPLAENKRKRRPGRPGAGRKRWSGR